LSLSLSLSRDLSLSPPFSSSSPPPRSTATVATGPVGLATSPPSSRDQSPALDRRLSAGNWRFLAGIHQTSSHSISSVSQPNQSSEVSRGVGYPALRQTPYVALVTGVWGDM
ncbi:organic cation/carnitine transporter 3, partial [Prunus dulcis]